MCASSSAVAFRASRTRLRPCRRPAAEEPSNPQPHAEPVVVDGRGLAKVPDPVVAGIHADREGAREMEIGASG